MNREKKFIVFGQILLIYIIPVLLLYFNIFSKSSRVLVLFVVSLIIYGILKHEKISLNEIGYIKSFKSYFKEYLVGTLIALSFLILYAYFFNYSPVLNWWKNPHFWLLFVFVSFAQEFLYRGFLPLLLKKISNNFYFLFFINTILFTLLHVIFPNKAVALPLAFLAGVFFNLMYYRFPNLLLISISHSILNFFAVFLGFFLI
jgi:membrane protease YdiL (CAAX protease family)